MPQWVRQAAAIPVLDGELCLVTSSSGRRWVIPKGTVEPGQTGGETALQEAWEEAGVAGALHGEPVGSYLYEKYGTLYHVTVFLMRVTEVHDEWPECGRRQRRWFSPDDAATRVDEEGLRDIIDLTLRPGRGFTRAAAGVGSDE
jgi:8-oxo-dGTP pyrophosphatase MutT (NUDIX family)